ncbi:MAG TPA: hypothetical protein VME46_25025 [Acidimicrobiales bacterium]|nr:hypothetical protein [Acidimicrobiales bacterium]
MTNPHTLEQLGRIHRAELLASPDLSPIWARLWEQARRHLLGGAAGVARGRRPHAGASRARRGLLVPHGAAPLSSERCN